MSKTGCYFQEVIFFEVFLGIVKKSAGAWYAGRLYTHIDDEVLIEKTAQPFLHDLILGIKVTFDIFNNLIRFTAFDPISLLYNACESVKFGEKEIDDLCCSFEA